MRKEERRTLPEARNSKYTRRNCEEKEKKTRSTRWKEWDNQDQGDSSDSKITYRSEKSEIQKTDGGMETIEKKRDREVEHPRGQQSGGTDKRSNG